MKKIYLNFSAIILCLSIFFVGCPSEVPQTNSTNNSQQNNSELKISGGSYTKTDGKIELTSVDDTTGEGVEYTITGTYTGQIVSKVKGTKIKLNGVTLSNENNPVIYCEKKCEISTVKDTVNKILMTGSSKEKTAAILGEKDIEFGGSGECSVKGDVCHGIKGDKISFKGSGTYIVSATNEGSAINCNQFEIKTEKTVNLTLTNGKNGIKADKNVSIESGTLHITDCATAIKTDTSKDDNPDAAPVEHFIKINGAKIYLKNISGKNKFSTEGTPQIAEGCVVEE